MMDTSNPAPATTPAKAKRVLVLQGGGALGSYQAGAYQALCHHDFEPEWVAGISIGAINAAIIAGNPREERVGRLKEFWETVSSPVSWNPVVKGDRARSLPPSVFPAFSRREFPRRRFGPRAAHNRRAITTPRRLKKHWSAWSTSTASMICSVGSASER